MMRLRLLSSRLTALLLIVLTATGCTRSLPGRESAPVQLQVRALGGTAPMPRIFRAGLYTFSFWAPPPPYVQKKLFNELKPGIIEIDLGNPVMKQSRNFGDLLKRLRSFDELATKVQNSGGELVVAINWMPDWLSSNLKDRTNITNDKSVTVANLSPPRDYEAWARVVEAIGAHFKRDLGVDVRYKIWWEPDTEYWQGTEAEFFKLYRYSVLGLRRADPTARVGGPSVSDIFKPYWRNKKNMNEPMFKRFIEYCARTPLPELGLSRIPIDFLVWHRFNANPYSTYAAFAARIRRWLSEYGYPTDTEQLIGEWSSWEEDNPQNLSPERDWPYMASFVITSLIEMDKAGIQHHAFTSLLEQETADYARFSGGFGIFTKDLIIKPVFNAFKALSNLGSTRLVLHNSDPFIRGIASLEDNTISVLISNYVPQASMLKAMPGERMLALGYDPTEIRQYVKTNEIADALLEYRLSVDELDAPERMRRDIRALLAEKRELSDLASRRRSSEMPVELVFEDLPFDSGFSFDYFAIDDSHANSSAVSDKIDRFSSEVQDLAAVDRRARASGYTDEDVRLLTRVLTGDVGTGTDQISQEDRDRASKMVDHLWQQVLDEVNNWPEVGLTAVQKELVDPTKTFKVNLNLQPYSVALVVLRGQPAK